MKEYHSNKQLREFGFIFGLGLPIILGFIIPALLGHVFKIWTIFVGFPFVVLGLLKPKLLVHFYKFWMLIGEILGLVNGKIILSFVFFFVLVPISFVMKIFNYDPLKKKKSSAKSYRQNLINKKIDLKRIF